MNPDFKPDKVNMVTGEEKLVVSNGGLKHGVYSVFILCKCDCGKEFIFSAKDFNRRPYSCDCTKEPNGLNAMTEEMKRLAKGIKRPNKSSKPWVRGLTSRRSRTDGEQTSITKERTFIWAGMLINWMPSKQNWRTIRSITTK